jgi:hypothetical protein
MSKIGKDTKILTTEGAITVEKMGLNRKSKYYVYCKDNLGITRIKRVDAILKIERDNSFNIKVEHSVNSSFELGSDAEFGCIRSNKIYYKKLKDITSQDKLCKINEKFDPQDDKKKILELKPNWYLPNERIVSEYILKRDLWTSENVIALNKNYYDFTLDNLVVKNGKTNDKNPEVVMKESNQELITYLKEGIRIYLDNNNLTQEIWERSKKKGFLREGRLNDYLKEHNHDWNSFKSYIEYLILNEDYIYKTRYRGVTYSDYFNEGYRLLKEHGTIDRYIWNDYR